MMMLYHGSDVEIRAIDLSLSQRNKDFGRGFYLSDDLEQAKKFAQYKADKPHSETKTPVVTGFSFDEGRLTDHSLRVLRFAGYNLQWVQFIKANRQARNTDYDVVIGPIANDDVRTQFVRHLLGEISEEELMESLKWKRCTYQYCFITDEAVSLLKNVGRL
jgi:hypothetical protein